MKDSLCYSVNCQNMEGRTLIVLVLATLCIQWSGQETVDADPVESTTVPIMQTTTPNIQTAMPTVQKENIIANAINNFGYKLLVKMMNEKKNSNIIVSPTGVAGLLAMTLLGSVGTTHNEIAETLGFSQDILQNRKNHEQFGELLQALNSNVSSKTLYADAMFVDAHAPLRELYRSYLHDVYRGEVLSADFNQTEETKNSINEWVTNHTEGKIEQLIKHPLPISTKVVLLTALYFSGQWEKPFVPEYTLKMPFKRPTDEVMADLMLNFGTFRYIFSEKHDFHIIALPYNDSETTMYALKPRFPKKLSLLDLMQKIDYEQIDEVINEMTPRKCVVRFPKMDIISSTTLENALKAVGVKTMFIPGEANFALMINSNTVVNKTEEEIITKIRDGEVEPKGERNVLDDLPNPGIYVDSVLHDVKLTINEFGTEAVAATSGILARSAEQFYANSPFYIFIRNERTKLVTFSAVIFDPTN
ncbi:hypothetical protein PYW07_002359 [Mythimna separata]|uniref:Serpin domain-containing protein n=1 Tax=Mythimna separata TaxID=271217 RepID=A0AAD8DU91_MYTSE|nr:hypothetical protein PYW07_002359 [Mythimna separata]